MRLLGLAGIGTIGWRAAPVLALRADLPASHGRERSRNDAAEFPARFTLRALFDFFEVNALVDRQALQVTAQAIKPHFHGAQAHPVAAADNAAATRGEIVCRGACQAGAVHRHFGLAWRIV